MIDIKNIVRNLCRPVLPALAGLALLTSTASAATMDFWVLAKGTQWALLVPGSNTGGKVIYNAKYGCPITDRAARGEYMEVDFWASTTAERKNPAISRCWLSSAAGSVGLTCRPWKLASYTGFTVPTSPAWDNNYVNIQTVSGNFSTRVPVGTR
jgi:hypothetical protein